MPEEDEDEEDEAVSSVLEEEEDDEAEVEVGETDVAVLVGVGRMGDNIVGGGKRGGGG